MRVSRRDLHAAVARLAREGDDAARVGVQDLLAPLRSGPGLRPLEARAAALVVAHVIERDREGEGALVDV